MSGSPRTARVVVGGAALCALLGSAGLLAGTGAAVAGETPVRTAGRDLLPQSFSFDGMSPGETRTTIVPLSSTRETDGAVVNLRVRTSGDLADSLSTSIEACSTPWSGDVCASGPTVLVDGWRGGQSGTSQEDVALPTGTTTWLKVDVTLDEDIPAGATGSIRYDLALQEASETAPGPGTDPGTPGGSDHATTDGSDQPGGAGGSGSVGRWSGPLAATGTTVWALAALSGALLGIGAALVRRRRRASNG